MSTTLEPRMQRGPWRNPVRCAAVALWCGFLGAVLNTLLLLALAPRMHAEDLLGIGALTSWFLLAWLIGLLPIGFALMLMAPPPAAGPPAAGPR